MTSTLQMESTLTTKESQCLSEIGKCKGCFQEVLKKFTKQRQSSLMKLEKQKDESLKRIRDMSRDLNINNKLQKVSFKISSRNKTSLLSSKSPKLRKKSSKKQIIATSKMVSRDVKKRKDSSKLGNNYHSVDSNPKLCSKGIDQCNSRKTYKTKHILSKERKQKNTSCIEKKYSSKDLKTKGHQKASSTVTISINDSHKPDVRKKLGKSNNKKSRKALFKVSSNTASMDKHKFNDSCIKGHNYLVFKRSSQEESSNLKLSSLQAQLEQKKIMKSRKKFNSQEKSLKVRNQKDMKSHYMKPRSKRMKAISSKVSPANREATKNLKGLKLKKLKNKDSQRSPCALKIGFKCRPFLESDRSGKENAKYQPKRVRRNRDDRKKQTEGKKLHKLCDHSVEGNKKQRNHPLSHKTSQAFSPHRALINLTGNCLK
ncbi:unnamed protein product [Moneuplotes crassus]|uniref:Uncharacterized protein n=1 Tax=Euplotes crassus TaxID=5936 RepID=A0AAD1U9F6_EUPCR|nr:unnamed protein product [Moneuplotes crassus]